MSGRVLLCKFMCRPRFVEDENQAVGVFAVWIMLEHSVDHTVMHDGLNGSVNVLHCLSSTSM